MVRYDPSIIHSFAGRLYRKAREIIALYTFIGAVLGLAGGYVLSRQLGLAEIIAAVIFGTIGYSLGRGRAFQLKLRAQIALCQAKIEENTRSRYLP